MHQEDDRQPDELGTAEKKVIIKCYEKCEKILEKTEYQQRTLYFVVAVLI